jgi:hypothetical protein
MARASKPEAATHEAFAKRAARPRTSVRHAKPAPEAVPQGADAAQPPEVEPPMPEPLLEVPVVAPERPIPAPEPATVMVALAEPPEAEPVAAGEPAVPADPAAALRQVRHLHGITLRFWQDQVERTVATGQAIMLCRSPQEAVRLQVAYIQATLASGYAHAGEVSRLSQDIARDMLPLRPR